MSILTIAITIFVILASVLLLLSIWFVLYLFGMFRRLDRRIALETAEIFKDIMSFIYGVITGKKKRK
jgi:hypothetical protein